MSSVKVVSIYSTSTRWAFESCRTQQDSVRSESARRHAPPRESEPGIGASPGLPPGRARITAGPAGAAEHGQAGRGRQVCLRASWMPLRPCGGGRGMRRRREEKGGRRWLVGEAGGGGGGSTARRRCCGKGSSQSRASVLDHGRLNRGSLSCLKVLCLRRVYLALLH
jgi:hypothetical protein